MTLLAPTLQAFFTDRLMAQRNASSNTIASYRDTFRLFLEFASKERTRKPCELDFADLDAPLVGLFLNSLEKDRGNSIRTRNSRLGAIHSFFGWALLRHPEHGALIQRVLAIPAKRFERNLVTFLNEKEVEEFLKAIPRNTWTGRRDYAMFVLAIQTGLRISELRSLTSADVVLGQGAHVHCIGKGRKERCTPLIPSTVSVLKVWLLERGGSESDPLLPTTTGRQLSRDAIEHRIALYVSIASKTCKSMKSKHVTTHTLRHTTAMRLLQSGVDVTVIALWLGHEQIATTNIYLHADMSQKEKAIARISPPSTKPGRYLPPDPVLAFLETL